MSSKGKKPYRGKCPICSGQLEVGPDDVLFCTKRPHYQVRRLAFELAWGKYDAGTMDADALVHWLVKANRVPNELIQNAQSAPTTVVEREIAG